MERCPNCGAPARPGAKFCTTCGVRLPDVPVATEPPPTEAAPEPAAASGWPALPTADASEAADGSSHGDQSPDVAVVVDEVVVASIAGTDDTAESSDQVLSSSWPAPSSSWTTGWETVEQQAPSAEDGDQAAPVAAETVEATEATHAAEMAAPEEAAPPIVLGQPFTPSPEATFAPASAAADPLTRAGSLLDELRALLPSLAGGAPAPDSAAIAADLEAAITPADAAATTDWDALRAAMAIARDRPRDIDTVLDLSQRVDAVIALIDAHDRCVAAIKRAVSALRQDTTPS